MPSEINPIKEASKSASKAWDGSPPKDDDEARERIIQAAKVCIARDGVSGAGISKVAKEVGVTRRTIYRLFPSSEDLIQHIAVETTGVTLNQMVAHVNQFESFQQRIVEAIIYLIKAIPEDSVLSKYFLGSFARVSVKKSEQKIHRAFTQESLGFSYEMLKMLHPGSIKSLDDVLFKQLAEHMQRTLLALIIAPSDSLKTDEAIREYLNNWLIPAVEKTLKV